MTRSLWMVIWNLLITGSGKLLMVAVTASVLLLRAWAGEPPSGHLVIAGSGTALPSIRPLAEAFGRVHPDNKISIPHSLGSTGGIRAVADGAITVGLTSRPLRGLEKKWGLTVLPYARTVVVIAAHPSVAEDAITSDELVQIYKGRKSRWRDGREIIVLTREPGNSSLLVLEQEVPGFREAYDEGVRAERWAIMYTYEEMIEALARTPYAIGLADMGAITSQRLPIKGLKFNGVLPTPENVLSGRYPLVKTMAFVFLKDKLPAGAEAFMTFVRSREGKKILRANGYLPAE